jgi:anti-sigma B factor antagonist
MSLRVVEFVLDEPQLTYHKMQPVEPQLDRLAEQAGHGTLRLDFRHVEHLTSMVLGKLVSLHKRMRDVGGALQLVNLNADLYELFQITRLNTFLDVRAKPSAGPLAAQLA